MAINVAGLIALIVFYSLILIVGIVAAWWKTRNSTSKGSEAVIVAGRDIGIFVGCFTMTATWVGGGYINGTAEVVFTDGLLYAQAPIGYTISLCLGGLFFARKMREREYLTMLDPFQHKYGNRIGGLLFLPALTGELFWSAAILNALGSSVSVIMDLDFNVSVIASACIAVTYTFFGGLYSVAYTDVLQLGCIMIGLVLTIPFAWKNPRVCWDPMPISNSSSMACQAVYNDSWMANGTYVKEFSQNWVGTIPPERIGNYVDNFILLILGGIPWQVYFQRVLSVEKPWQAQLLSFVAAFGCSVMCIPSVIIGIIAKHTDWQDKLPVVLENPQVILPMVIAELTPPSITFFGLGAISAAVMSSCDSSILSASSMFAHNIYKLIFRQKASEREVVWVVRVSVVACGVVATTIGLSIGSVYSLFALCGDFVFVILFPQFLLVIYWERTNSYGVLSGYVIGLMIRLLGGDPTLGIPQVIPFPNGFPYKTLAMFINLFVTMAVSELANYEFGGRRVPDDWDVLHFFHNRKTHHGFCSPKTLVPDDGPTQSNGLESKLASDTLFSETAMDSATDNPSFELNDENTSSSSFPVR